MGPVTDLLNAGTDFVTAQLAIQRRSQPLEIGCMRDKGFDFQPIQLSREQIRRDGYTSAFGTRIAEKSFREREGYGVTSSLVGITGDEATAPEQIRGYGQMSLTEQQAADKALEQCSVAGVKSLSIPAVEQLIDGWAEASARVGSDSRTLATAQACSACMRASGYVVTDENSPVDQLDEKARLMLEAGDVNTPQAKALHQEELAIAKVDWDCRVKHVNKIRAQVRDEYEGAYLNDHPELVERVRAEMQKIIAQ